MIECQCGEALVGVGAIRGRCDACQDVHDRESEEYDRRLQRRQAQAMHRRAADLARQQLPPWPVATPVTEVVACMHPRLQRARERYRLGDRSLLLTGPSGAGKTIWCADAVLKYAHWVASDECDPLSPEAHRLHGFLWTTGHALVRANRYGDQGDPELIERAKRASVLVLDELTAEPISEVPFEVVHARYAAGLPTIVTSGLIPEGPKDEAEPVKLSSFRGRYGDAMWRRLTEAGVGASIDLHGGGK